VKEATAAYFDEQDLFGQWIEECCELEPRAWEQTSVLFASWRSYAERNGEAAGDVRKFGPMLSKRGFLPERIGRPRGYRGICIKKTEEWQDRYDR
jgi:putative DNA primase/helicase